MLFALWNTICSYFTILSIATSGSSSSWSLLVFSILELVGFLVSLYVSQFWISPQSCKQWVAEISAVCFVAGSFLLGASYWGLGLCMTNGTSDPLGLLSIQEAQRCTIQEMLVRWEVLSRVRVPAWSSSVWNRSPYSSANTVASNSVLCFFHLIGWRFSPSLGCPRVHLESGSIKATKVGNICFRVPWFVSPFSSPR